MLPADWSRSDDVERTHHFIVFMFENVTVPDKPSREVAEPRDDSCHFSRWTSYDVFPGRLSWLWSDSRPGELYGTGVGVLVDVEGPPVKDLEVDKVQMDGMVVIRGVDETPDFCGAEDGSLGNRIRPLVAIQQDG